VQRRDLLAISQLFVPVLVRELPTCGSPETAKSIMETRSRRLTPWFHVGIVGFGKGERGQCVYLVTSTSGEKATCAKAARNNCSTLKRSPGRVSPCGNMHPKANAPSKVTAPRVFPLWVKPGNTGTLLSRQVGDSRPGRDDWVNHPQAAPFLGGGLRHRYSCNLTP
jgi:hypothetical protein